MPQAQTVQIPKRWPLVSKLQARNPNVPLTKDARLINCYAEYDPEDRDYWIYKRVGLSSTPAFTTAAPYLKGLGAYAHSATGLLFYIGTDPVSGITHLYASGLDLGALANGFTGSANFGPFWFETVNSNPQTVVMGNGVVAYIVNTSTLAISNITDANFPGNNGVNIFVPGWAYVDGYLYAMDHVGQIWGTTGVNNAASWSALNLIQASSNADLGVALAKQLNYVIAFKQWTTQIFYDAGNATGSPLAPVPDAQIPFGCVAGLSVQQIDNVLLWLSSNQTNSPQVVRLDNLTPKVISTPAVERILDNATWTNVAPYWNSFAHQWTASPAKNLYSWILKHGGHRFYGLSLVNSGITLVYDIDQDLWYIWQDFTGNWWPLVSLSYQPSLSGVVSSSHYAQHFSNGNIYYLDGDYQYPNDFGNVFPVDIYTPNMDFGTDRRKYLKTMYINGDKVSSTLNARFSDDDYQNFSTPRSIDLSVDKPRLPDCGTFRRRRAYHFRHQGNTAFRIKTIDLQMDLGVL